MSPLFENEPSVGSLLEQEHLCCVVFVFVWEWFATFYHKFTSGDNGI